MNLRIYGNRLLKTLPGQATRPTPSRVREAVFNIWQNTIEGCHWLDLCAGNGSMGAEALCRGAASAIAIEQSNQACLIIRENWQKIATSSQNFKVLRGDILTRIKTLDGQEFDHIYFDPPYASSLYQPVLDAIALFNLLSPQGELAVEHDPQRWNIKPVLGLEVCREKVYGNTALTFYCACSLAS